MYCTISYVLESNSPDICIVETKSQILIKLAWLFQRGNSCSLLLTQYFDQIKKNEMGRASGMCGEMRVTYQVLAGNPVRKGQLGKHKRA